MTEKMACYYGFLYKSSSFKVCWYMFSLMILGYEESNVAGMVTLSPMTVAPVCRVGEPLQLICTASVNFIKWNILQANEQGTLVDVVNSVQTNSLDANQMSQRIVNSAAFTFLRTSAEDASPLISTLSINSTSIGLNGTVVRCSNVGDPMTSASTTIQIVDTSQIKSQYTPILKTSEKYGADNVTVTVEWTQKMGALYYDIKVSPLASLIINERAIASYDLRVSYNTEYNLSVVAVAPCANATSFVILDYVNCGYPQLLSTMSNNSLISNDSVPSISAEYAGLPIEGNTVTFSCPPGLALTGPNSAICTENGEWEPDPSGLMCKGIESKAHLTGRIIGFFVPVAIILSITAVVITIILHKKGCIHRVRKQHTQHTQGGKFTTKHLDKESRLVYADLDVTSEAQHYVTKEKPTAEPSTLNRDVEYSLIDYSLNVCYEDTQLEGQPKRDDSLDVTLNRLVVLLREQVGPKWREFGEEVDIDEVVLDSIAKTCFSENCLVEVLDYWLKYTDEKITWRDVAYVLKSINFHELALDVVQIYKTGKFPHGANTHANKSPQDCNKQLAERKQKKAPVDPKKGSVDSSKCQKTPKTPLPLPSKK